MQKQGLLVGRIVLAFLFISSINATSATFANHAIVLKADSFKHYIDTFNEDDEELYVQHIPNEKAWEFL